MIRFIEGTWLATLLFVVAGIYPVYVLGLLGLVITPTVWWLLIARRRRSGAWRGALAGLLIVVLILLGPTLYVVHSGVFEPQPESGLAGLIGIAIFFYLLVAWVVGLPLGAGLGALAGRLQKLKYRQEARQEARDREVLAAWDRLDAAWRGL